MARVGRTQADVGQAVGLPQTQIGQRLRGEIPWRFAEVVAVAAYLGADFYDLTRPAVAAAAPAAASAP